MNRQQQMPDAEYERNILQRVSRSFALTIPELPFELRGAVTNAYLVCRIIDTIEDDENLSLEQKLIFFEEFVSVINRRTSARKFADSLFPLLSGRTLESERELVKNTPVIMRGTFSLNENQRKAIVRCAETMAWGMAFFQKNRNLAGLSDLREFERYCYYVAGVVGEMLTELFCGYSPEIMRNRERLLELAVSFGLGLQMTNIIKDLWEDRSHKACWLPQDIFRNAGYDLKNLGSGEYSQSFGRGIASLVGIARGHLEKALQYTLLIPPDEVGIRRFCLWAIGMAVFTLRNVNRKHDYRSGQEVKISRRTLKSIILISNLMTKNDFMLKRIFNISSRNLSTK